MRKEQKIGKRAIYGKLALVASIVAFFIPVSLFGAVAKVGETEYDNITDAMNAWAGGTTLTLLADAQMTATKSFRSSDAARTLNLSTFTLTAAKSKHAIQITNGGLSSTSYRLTINADKDNPGGITTSGSSYYAVYYSNTSKDRVGVIINGGVFNGGALYMRTGGGTKAGAVLLNGGTFNGGISLNRENTTINGGRYNGSFSVSVDSTCRLYICGGSFKNFPIQTWSADLPFKMALGSSIGYAVTAAQIEANPEKYPEFSGTYNYMNYSTSPATPMYPLDKNGQYMYATPTKFDRYVYRGSDSYYYVESTNALPAKLESKYFSSSVAKTDITTVGNVNFWKHVTDVKVPVYCVNVSDAFALTGVNHGITVYGATDVGKTDFPGVEGNTFFINREGDVDYTGTIGFNNCYEAVKTANGVTNIYTAVLNRAIVAASVVTFDSWGKGTTNNYETTAAAVAAMKKTGSSQTLVFYKDASDNITFTTAYASTVLTIELQNNAKYTGTVSFGSKYNTLKNEDAENERVVFTPAVKPENASIVVSGNGEPRYFEDSWDQFNAAMKSARDGDTVKVLKTIYNLNLNTGDSYEINGHVTLDLTGHEIRFSSSEGLWLTGTGKLSITNGTVQASYCAIYVGTGSVALELTDVTAKSTYSSSYYARGPIAFAAETGCGKVVINSGTYTGVGKKDFKNGTADNTVIYGGTFQFDPTAFVAAGCKVNDNGDGTWTVETAKKIIEEADEGGIVELPAISDPIEVEKPLIIVRDEDNKEMIDVPEDSGLKKIDSGDTLTIVGYEVAISGETPAEDTNTVVVLREKMETVPVEKPVEVEPSAWDLLTAAAADVVVSNLLGSLEVETRDALVTNAVEASAGVPDAVVMTMTAAVAPKDVVFEETVLSEIAYDVTPVVTYAEISNGVTRTSSVTNEVHEGFSADNPVTVELPCLGIVPEGVEHRDADGTVLEIFTEENGGMHYDAVTKKAFVQLHRFSELRVLRTVSFTDVAFDAFGGTVKGAPTVRVASYPAAGYSFPADPVRPGYAFLGWFRSWTNGAAQVEAHAPETSPFSPAAAHTLYAKWAPVAGAGQLLFADTDENGPNTEIADQAYVRRTDLKAIAVSSFVTNIGTCAFSGCVNVESLVFAPTRDWTTGASASLHIGSCAFTAMTKLEKVTLPAEAVVDCAAFQGCTHLSEITFTGPVSVDWTVNPFAGCGRYAENGKVTIHLAYTVATNQAFCTAFAEALARSADNVVLDMTPCGKVDIIGGPAGSADVSTITFTADLFPGWITLDTHTVKVLGVDSLNGASSDVARLALAWKELEVTAVDDLGGGTNRVTFIPGTAQYFTLSVVEPEME